MLLRRRLVYGLQTPIENNYHEKDHRSCRGIAVRNVVRREQQLRTVFSPE